MILLIWVILYSIWNGQDMEWHAAKPVHATHKACEQARSMFPSSMCVGESKAAAGLCE